MLIYSSRRVYVYREGDGYRITIPTAHSSSTLTVSEMTDLCVAVITDQARNVPGANLMREALSLLFQRGD